MVEDVFEEGITEVEAVPYIAIKAFYLGRILGPSILVKIGQKVWLSKATGDQLFYAGKVEPVILGSEFEVIQPFREIDPEKNEYVYFEVGDVLKLERSEAIKLLRELKVKKGGLHEIESTEKFLDDRKENREVCEPG